MNWSARPFVRILLFFVAGILISEYIPFASFISTSILFVIAITLLLFATVLTYYGLRHKYSQLIGVIFGLLITTSGILITSQKVIDYQDTKSTLSSVTYVANIISNPTETKQSVKAILSVTPVNKDKLNSKLESKVLGYFAKDEQSLNLKYGDVITFNSKLTTPKKPLNPGEFNYSKYLLQNGIRHTAYIGANRWKLIGYNPSSSIIAMASSLRQGILETLKKNGLSGSSYAVAAAVLLGYDDFMENDLKQDYIMSGSMHILCVSGLHVGIIFLVISYLLSFLRNNKLNNILKSIILLLSVWTYATITGLSPSVQRASLMLSVFIIGNLLKRNRDTINTLAISALFLLLINPLLIFNVGFQLSYAAVLGILIFHQPIYKLLYIKNTLFDGIWSITVLSFAAQLATFPIAVHYFHFFPPWFWLTNIFTFPLSFLIVATGLLFVLTSWLPLVPQLIGWTLSGMVYLLNSIVGFVNYLPFSGIENIYISIPMLLAIYLLISFTFVMFNNKKPALVLPVLVMIAAIMMITTYHQNLLQKQKRVAIYSINNHSVYDFINGQTHTLIADSTITNNTIDYHLKNNRAIWGIDKGYYQMPLNDTVIDNNVEIISNFLIFNNLKLFLCDNNCNLYSTNSKMKLDLVIISGKNKNNFKNLLSVFDINKVVIDSSVPRWNQRVMENYFSDKGIECHNVNTDGALIMDL